MNFEDYENIEYEFKRYLLPTHYPGNVNFVMTNFCEDSHDEATGTAAVC